MNNDENKNDIKKVQSLSSIEYDARNVTKDKIISILSMPLEKRTLSQKTMLTFFCLNVSKLPQKFIKEHIDKASYINIISLSESSFSYKLILNKNTFVYEVYDIANYLYIILKGTAKIIKPEKYIKDMNAHEYYKILMNYKNNNELRLLERTIKENYHIFQIEQKDINNLEKIYLKVLILRLEEKYNEEPVENLIDKVGLKMSDFGIITYREELEIKNRKIDEENNFLIMQKKMNQLKPMIFFNYEKEKQKNWENLQKVKKVLKNINSALTHHYYFLVNEGKSSITYYKFIEYNNISANDYFGDLKNDKYIHRVISTSDELELLLMKNDIYLEFMKIQKNKIKAEQINFLVQNFFFNSIGKLIFEKIYYDLFEYENYKINDIILKENTEVEYLYFIQSGKVSLISNKSIIENHLIINIIYDILKKQNKKYKNGSIHDKYLQLYSSSYIQNFDKINKEINSNKINNIMIYQENQCIGHECFFFGFNYLYSAIAKSEVVEVYKIGVDKLRKIIKDKGSAVHHDFAVKSFQSLFLFFKLMINLNTNLLNYYHKNKTNEGIKIEEKKYNNADDNKINNSRNLNISEIKSINIERKEQNNWKEDESYKYRSLPLLAKSQKKRSFSFNNAEYFDKINIKNKRKKLENLSLFQFRNTNLFASHSFRSSNSSNNISKRNSFYKFKNANFSSTIISNNNSTVKSGPIFENSILKKLRKQSINSINLFNLTKNNFDTNNADTNINNINNADPMDNNNSSNIITFDFPIQQHYKYPLSVKNKETKNKTIDYKKNPILFKMIKNHVEFDNYYKFYSSEFYSNQDFIKNYFKYNNKLTIITNKKLLKYGLLDILRPKNKRINKSSNFKIFGNLSHNRNSDKFISKKKPTMINKLNNFIKNEKNQIDIKENGIDD